MDGISERSKKHMPKKQEPEYSILYRNIHQCHKAKYDDNTNKQDSKSEDMGKTASFKKIISITVNRIKWWISFMTDDNKIHSGYLSTVKLDAQNLGFEDKLQKFAKREKSILIRCCPRSNRRQKK
eukprot:11090418-Ditylum_brightwellii.AAC.1